ncbi:cytochrome P460 family protein [Paenirhodobacter sp.]|uniref:cytochrome P460 family protein n=1 Tax=Paenirhodobacter sp. TaxID=1965326 RepID=UPI003B40E577
MKKRRAFAARPLASALAFVGGYLTMPGGTPAFAQGGTVTFPVLEELVHYTTVRRGVTREHMLTNQNALDAIQAGAPVPTGTHVVLVDYQSDVLTRYLIAEKTGDGPDDWAYQSFNTDQSLRTVDESPARCYSCHQTRQDRQYLFTYNDARSFKP